jgi:hypothetical protein
VRAHVSGPVNFSVVYLDYQRLEQESHRESLATTLRLGYGEAKPDVLIVSSIEAIRFITQYREQIFPGVPMVFTRASTSELEGLKLLPGMTGVTGSVGLRDTIDLALRLHPDANAVALIEAKTGFWWAAAHAELLRHQDKVREIDVIGPPSTQMLARIDARRCRLRCGRGEKEPGIGAPEYAGTDTSGTRKLLGRVKALAGDKDHGCRALDCSKGAPWRG